jgi:hypothetical protein
MAYTHDKQEFPVSYATGTTYLASSLGIFVSGTASYKVPAFRPTYVPHLVHACCARIVTSLTSTAILKFIKGNVGLTGTLTTIATLQLNTDHDAGDVVYKDGLGTEVSPGQELKVKLYDASAGVGRVVPVIYTSHKWEVPGNNSYMATTPTT